VPPPWLELTTSEPSLSATRVNPPGRHVLQDRLLAEIEFHDIRHVGVDRLVVGDAGADRVRQRDVAGRIGRHQAGHAERGIGTEGEGIEKIIVDTAIDHVDPLQPFRGAHEHLVVLDDEVAAFDQLDAELVGEERVLVIGGVVDARRHQCDGWLRGRAIRCHRAQRGQQFVRIAFDWRDAVAREQVWKQPHHDLAIFQHVGHARRRARVILERDEILGVDPDDVDAGDVNIDVVRHVLAVHLRTEYRILEDQVVRDDPGAENVAAVIDVPEEHVERAHALAKPPFQQRPFLRRKDARNHVKGDQPFLGLGIAIDREGDADPAKQQLGFLAAIFEGFRRRFLQPAGEFLVGRAEMVPGTIHLIERNRHRTPSTPCATVHELTGW
jgi:hypothetical protein